MVAKLTNRRKLHRINPANWGAVTALFKYTTSRKTKYSQ
jgi:hypothetical protein